MAAYNAWWTRRTLQRMRWKRPVGASWILGGTIIYSLSWHGLLPGVWGGKAIAAALGPSSSAGTPGFAAAAFLFGVIPCALALSYACGVRLFPRLWTAFALRWTGAAVCWLVAFCLLVNGVTQPGIDSSPAAFAFAVYTVSRPDWSYGADTFSSWTLCLLPPAYLGESASLASSRPPTA